MAHSTRLSKMMFALMLTLAMGCSEDTPTKAVIPLDPVPPDTTTPPSTAPSVSTTEPFALKISTKFNGFEYSNQLNFTETGTDTCTATDASPVINCTVSIPEGQLYYSSLTFNFSRLATKCPLLQFVPYQYKASSSATYVPPGATSTIDCTAVPTPVDCFGGVAMDIVPSYPASRGVVYLPDLTDLTTPVSTTETFNSASSKTLSSNRRTVNNLPLAKRGVSYTSSDLGGAGDGYVANSYRDYQFTCRDSYYDTATYTINVYVTEEDSAAGNPAQNDFFTWSELP